MAVSQRYVMFVGNPGAGKSTLLNCVMYTEVNRQLEKQEKFSSGISLGTGMTFQLEKKTLGDTVYMDTPGLSDVSKRKEAAEAITEALKQDGKYNVVFVVTLEAGRVRPDDVATIRLVLESSKEITHYGIVFNKVGMSVKKNIDDSPMEWLSMISHEKGEEKRLPFAFSVELHMGLYDKANAIIRMPELNGFLKGIPPVHIHKGKVQKLRYNEFEEIKNELTISISILREQNKALQIKMKEDREYFSALLKEIEKKNKGWLGKRGKIGACLSKSLRKVI